MNKNIDGKEALSYLKMGNEKYLETGKNTKTNDILKRSFLVEHGQCPYCCVVTCADSRVCPEFIFNAGLGDIFVIRNAGNVLDDATVGSIEYAVEHLGCNLVVILGHTCCGAVTSALEGAFDGAVGKITRRISNNVGAIKDNTKAVMENASKETAYLRSLPFIDVNKQIVISALYHTDKGNVEFFE